MPTPAEATSAIYARWISLWTATPYTFDNEKFDPVSNKAWARVVTRQLVSAQETLGRIGARRFRREGIIIIQIFVPPDTGTREARELAKAAADIYEGVSFSSVDCTNAQIAEISDQPSWFQVNVEVDYAYEESR